MTDQALGASLRAKAQGPKSDKLRADLASLDNELAEWVDGFGFGRVWSRKGLPFEQRMMVAIVALASIGATGQLRNYLFGAIHADMDPRAIHEALVMICLYAGFPAAIQSLQVWREVIAAVERSGKAVDLDQPGS
jgi:4-carboxymuconolactone decarboxylase